ncbi:uncharacterized protein GGS25DRAFT_483632 [Hypoxylon fragiforme]|uniref:uncharacterized protein n=1 Tax=Hypoxylon fragiforme TaxID=63214 RepID=UPI0020C5CDE5|nr:uncharacterized protein GGS25DRAFT_483632 [Hypoxylon fragiforme]KAI2611677.1 hypothetical protein GGS25DRAFT_483632 [Hypoxylon fragiforme]
MSTEAYSKCSSTQPVNGDLAVNITQDGSQSDHCPIQDPLPNTCAECKRSFPTRKELKCHAESWNHTKFVFKCSCGNTFARSDALNRHCKTLSPAGDGKYPCTSCKSHRGKHAFRRKDHLIQHLRGYHKFDFKAVKPLLVDKGEHFVRACPHLNCGFHRGKDYELLPLSHEKFLQRPFEGKLDYYGHMKDAHNQTPFPCYVDGCIRVGSKGYTTVNLLIAHLTKKHPQEQKIICLWAGPERFYAVYCKDCNSEFFGLEDLSLHRQAVHQSDKLDAYTNGCASTRGNGSNIPAVWQNDSRVAVEEGSIASP